MADTQRQLLPTCAAPISYDLHLTPDLSAFSFDGDVKVCLSIKEETSVLTFHTLELDIKTASISQVCIIFI